MGESCLTSCLKEGTAAERIPGAAAETVAGAARTGRPPLQRQRQRQQGVHVHRGRRHRRGAAVQQLREAGGDHRRGNRRVLLAQIVSASSHSPPATHSPTAHTHTRSISERRAATHEHPGYILPFFYSLFPSYTVPHFDDPQQDGAAEHPHDA